jgi:CDP-6-deoxy-D-xylo-4-hexulose-3-dehydrase
MIVNVLGHPNEIHKISEICEKYNVILLEDSCEALGTNLHKKKTGTHGFASSFSFYYGHHISTIEGGMVTTDDFNLYNIMLSIRSHGWSRDIDNNLRKFNKLMINYMQFSNFWFFNIFAVQNQS